MSQPRIFIGMPAYNGKAFIAATLASIRAQRCVDFRVVVSIDGNDRETAGHCQPFLSDSRFEIQMQQQRLGWEGNFNWLLSRSECEFFCYWQQDDLTTEDYLEALLLASHNCPAAACYYSDIEWFGETKGAYIEESVTGLPVSRALSIFEKMNGIPNRGLIRRSAIERAGPVASNDFESAFEEYVWIAKLAREGNLLRVPGPTYFKRAHVNATSFKWLRKPRAWKRKVWIEFGLGMLETVWPLVRPEDRLTTFGIVLDRLCNARKDRFMLYDGATVPFAFDFLEVALKEYPVPELLRTLYSRERAPRFAGEIGGNVMDAVAEWISTGQIPPLVTEHVVKFDFGQAGVDLLSEGWSTAEDWGTWSNEQMAIIRLPPGRGKILKLSFVAFGKQGSNPTINVDGDQRRIASWRVPALALVTKELTVPTNVEHIEFKMPDAISPAAIEHNQDARLLGIGVVSLELRS
jgi:GT2 family glycosyltransferase